jgi:hypothetical protein
MAEAQTNTKIDLSEYFPTAKSNDPVVQKSGKQSSTREDIQNILDLSLPAIKANVGNPYKKGKEVSFGADLDHTKFERYYTHPNFSKLGFNPFLDNESIYNKNSTFTDDLSRAGANWSTLAGLGLKDAFGFGPTTDRKAAKEYERAVALGTSTRGGVGGFMNNLYLNSGYTFGIMGEILAEEAVLFGATVLSGGATSWLAAERSAMNAGRFVKALFTGAEWTKKANKIIKGLDALSDVNVARNVFQGLKAGTIATGKFVGRNMVPESYQFLSNFNKLDNLGGVAKTVTGFGAMYRDVRNVRLAFGESALEGGMVENDMITEGYNDFVRKNGRDPNSEEATTIRNTAKSAGLATTWQNLPVIYFSNNIVLGSFMKSFSPLRRLLPTSADRFAKTIFTKGAFKDIKTTGIEGLKNLGKSFINPKAYARFGLNYISGNLAEGAQETAQEIISGTNKDYYKKLNGNATRGGYYDALVKNVGKQASAEGLEIFASGFFMGGLVGGASGIAVGVKEKGLQFFDKNYAAKKEAALQARADKTKILNDIYSDPLSYKNRNVDNMVEQNLIADKMSKAEADGNQKLFQDAKNEGLNRHFWTVFEMEQSETFKERFEELKKLTPEELMEAIPTGGDPVKALAEIDNMSSKMDDFKKTYEFVKSNIPNEYNPSKYKKGTSEHQQEAINYLSFQEAQKDLIFMNHSTKTSLSRMTSIMNEAIKDVGIKNVSASDITNLFSIDTTTNEISKLKEEIKSFGTDTLVTPQAKKLKAEKEEKLKYLEAFATDMDNLIIESTPEDTEVNRAIGTASEDVIFTKENFFSQPVYDKALKAYKDYIKHLSKNELVSDKNVELAFEKMIDYYLLDHDAKRYNNAVNTLINPTQFSEYAERKKEVIELEFESRQIRINEALKAYEKKMAGNDLLTELYKINVFFDPEEWEALNEDGKMPSRLYNTTGKKEEILSTSAQFNNAVDLFKLYAENVLEIPLQYNKNLDNWSTESRNELPGGNRSYEELAEQYGFDPKATRTTLPLREVLQSIIDSDFATEQEQALARRLIKLAKADETVTFAKDLSGPGIFTTDEQTVIDARYSSKEYAGNAQTYPIEVSILREEINRRLKGALVEDTQFFEDINNLRTLAGQYYEDNKMSYEKPFVGLSSNAAFITEVMTSDEFRNFLQEVPSDATKNTGWQEFINKVVDWLNKVFANDQSNTALNGAINIITTKIDDFYKNAQGVKTDTTTKAKVNPQSMSVEELKASKPLLIEKLVTMYQEYNQIFEDTDPSMMVDPAYKSKTPDEIENSPEFREWIKGQGERIVAVFDQYFPAQQVRKIVRRPGSVEVLPGIPETISDVEEEYTTEEMKQGLLDLGYSLEVINSWTPYIAKNVLVFGQSKEETDRLNEEQEQEKLDDQTEARKELAELFDSIENINDYNIAETKIISKIIRFTTIANYTGDELTNMLLEKKREIAFKTDFDEIQVGDYVIKNDLEKGYKGVYKVEKKTKNQLTLINNKTGKVTYVNRKGFNEDNQNNLIFKYKPEQEEMGLKVDEITDEETKISNQDVSAIEQLSDEDIVNAIKDGKNADPSNTKNEFLDSLDDLC